MSRAKARPSLLVAIGPGLLVAATGVGAGDLATAGFAGSKLGVAVLWAVVAGAFFKFVLNEGLARWQLATGETLLEGAIGRLGAGAALVFLVYLLPWSWFVGGALMSACAVTADALAPVFEDRRTAMLTFGAAHSAAGVLVAWVGGYKVFERIMAISIGVMFVAVVLTAALLRPDLAAIARGLLVPTIPEFRGEGLSWTIALMGGVGGTLTVLCYGYWMREEGRVSTDDLSTCRVDLGVAYAGTAIFGIAMIVIAADLPLDAGGTDLIVGLAARLDSAVGTWGRWLFLIGVWAAVFSSLLGVWQAVPYIFADTCALLRPALKGRRSMLYRGFLLAIAVVPLVQVTYPLVKVQKYYAVMGAAFIPLLAVALLILNGRAAWVGARFRNRPLTVAVLLAALGFFLVAGVLEIRSRG